MHFLQKYTVGEEEPENCTVCKKKGRRKKVKIVVTVFRLGERMRRKQLIALCARKEHEVETENRTLRIRRTKLRIVVISARKEDEEAAENCTFYKKRG